MTPRAVTELVVRMAGEHPTWGYTRIRGALANLGHHIARNTVKRILHDHGIAPAPERNQRTPWKTFLQAHWEGLAAADLFTVEVLTLAGLRRYFVFFVIALKTRRVHIAGIHPQPDGRWMEQMARNLTDPVDGFLRTARQLIHDRDPLYTRVFGEILTSGDVGPIRLPPKRPNLNAYAERFVRSIKEECLHRVVPLGEGHLRLIVHEYVEHYQRERNHQGLDNHEREGLACLPEDVLITAAGGASEIVPTATFMIGQELNIVALFDSDSAGKEAEEKLRKKWITRYKDARAVTLLLGDALGMSGKEATIEDLFEDAYYIEKVCESHELKLKSRGLATDAITLGRSGPILPRLQQCFDEIKVDFNKGSVGKLIRRDLIRCQSVDKLPPGVAKKGEVLLTAVRAAFGTSCE